MNVGGLSLNFNEKVIFALRALYLERGYSHYKMSKFEEYDLYARNKDFLISDSIITFTDTNGKLMALKPDVTLSIIKNMQDRPQCVQKVYYNENVYRISKGSNAFKEIMQVGLECLGDIDNYNICEVITLAAKSLMAISEECILDISHLGLIGGVIDGLGIPKYVAADILKCIGEKNIHSLEDVCAGIDIDSESLEILKLFITTSGNADEVLPYLESKLSGKTDITPIHRLKEIISGMDDDVKKVLHIDFSVVSDMKYYNGIVFKGFIKGIPSSVLSGGQYDRLLQKMNRKSGALGFAVYLDMLDRFNVSKEDYDVDIVILYNSESDPAKVNGKVESLTKNGKSVLACRQLPDNIKYRQLLTMEDCEVDALEKNA